MGEVVDLPVITTLDVDPDRIIQKAIGQMRRVVIIGIDKDGDEYFASSVADGGTVLWDLERAKMRLLRMPEEMG